MSFISTFGKQLTASRYTTLIAYYTSLAILTPRRPTYLLKYSDALAALLRPRKFLRATPGYLDCFLTNSPKWFDDPKQLPKIGTSDHYGVLVRQIKSRAKPTNGTFFRRDTRDSRLRAFGQWLTTH